MQWEKNQFSDQNNMVKVKLWSNICSKLKRSSFRTKSNTQGVFFAKIQSWIKYINTFSLFGIVTIDAVLVPLFLTLFYNISHLFSSVSIANFEQVNISWIVRLNSSNEIT